ncbi:MULTISPECIES: polyprenyl synthetase family protein [unclassified Pseudonocardia]|uniref:polyprenyl synthetase family protein n=1 Tax=unclassified Pseudonocardia TaxID=2619320 RepID=UPI0001FFF0E0|nr:polyprenyl synthetase family protein [Pseudonocardia sp. Ae707_Ps1]OLM18389.1 Geranylgeranyl diphosphate synthase [Pseudonocardia sp. Ae707_Ps1]
MVVDAERAGQRGRARPEEGPPSPPVAPVASWTEEVRGRVRDRVEETVRRRCAEHVHSMEGAEFLAGVLTDFVGRGKYLRSMFGYLGWRAAAPDSPAALDAVAGLELLHAFALLQDDVMDGSLLRRGRPTVHVQLAAWHRGQGMSGCPDRFGESGAVLLGDLCLVWAEQAMRESGLPRDALDRGWPRYDAMRSELAVGQFADLLNEARRVPTLDEVMDVLRRKSGNYTVRRPLELGAAMAGGGDDLVALLGDYGTMVGEAFQMRDDVLGVFGTDATGKPTGDDLAERKATSVVVLARELAGPATRPRLDALLHGSDTDDGPVDVAAARELIDATGARRRVEELISTRVAGALRLVEAAVDDGHLGDDVAGVLRAMAVRCADRIS